MKYLCPYNKVCRHKKSSCVFYEYLQCGKNCSFSSNCIVVKKEYGAVCALWYWRICKYSKALFKGGIK